MPLNLKFVYSGKNPSAPVAYCGFRSMHTVMELLFVHNDELAAKNISRRIKNRVDELDLIFNRHLENNELARLNGSMSPVKVSDELFFAFELCEQMRRSTKGYFDIAALSSTKEKPSFSLFPPSHEVSRTSGQVLIDFGGFAKGYAIDRVRTMLSEDFGVEKALINFGSSSSFGLGTHPLGDCWLVSDDRDRKRFRLKDSALSVSGRSRNGAGHIVDPHTLKCVTEGRDIAVTGPSALICEVLSTALYAAPENERKTVMEPFDNYQFQEL